MAVRVLRWPLKTTRTPSPRSAQPGNACHDIVRLVNGIRIETSGLVVAAELAGEDECGPPEVFDVVAARGLPLMRCSDASRPRHLPALRSMSRSVSKEHEQGGAHGVPEAEKD